MSEEEIDDKGWIKGRKGSRKPCELVLYVICEEGLTTPCKVGYAADIGRRLVTLNCGNHRRLVAKSVHAIERLKGESWRDYVDRVQRYEIEIHKQAAQSKIRGEWFHAESGFFEYAIGRLLNQAPHET